MSRNDRMRVVMLLVPVLLAVGLGGVILASDPDQGGVAAAVAADLEVEQALLEDALKRYDEHATRRARVVDRLAALQAALDQAVRSGDEGVDALLEEVERAEAERTELMTAQHVTVARIDEHRRRIQLLRLQLESLQTTDVPTGPLAGRWEVVLLPLEQRGVFLIRQTGAVVGGTYTLEGGWSGSLQGTLVDRKVHLVRIDSKLGRSMELEGRLSADGSRITGTWQNYELAAGSSSSGQWSASKSASGS